MNFSHFRIFTASLLLAGGTCSPVVAQRDDLSRSLQLTKESKSLALWSRPSQVQTADLSKVAKSIHPSIFLIGTSTHGYGTGFVVSKEHRLLATNAHVADIMDSAAGKLMAIQNGTSQVFEVSKVYYHPGVRRISGGVRIRSSDPKRGKVDPISPDVALVRLKPGPELPDSFKLAEPEELNQLFARPVAMIGFPGHDTGAWPALGSVAEGTFRQGVICRLTDFKNDAGATPSARQFVQHSMSSWFGFSGAPIFLDNGKVVALNNCSKSESQGGMSTSIAYAIRSDCLWELIKHHGLSREIDLPDGALNVDISKFEKEDENEVLLDSVEKLLALAAIEVDNNRESAAVEKCNEAIKMMPSIAKAYSTRGLAYNQYAVFRIAKEGFHQKKQYYEYANNDQKKAMQLDPTNPDYYLDFAMTSVNLTNNRNYNEAYQYVPGAIAIADSLITEPSLNRSRKMYALRIRAIAQGYPAESIRDLEDARALDPYNSQNYWALGCYWEKFDRNDLAGEMNRKYELYKSADAKVGEAMLLATSNDAETRNGTRAWALAKEACDATDYKSWEAISALAAAYAECAKYDLAIEYQVKANAITPAEEKDGAQAKLDFYRRSQPWRQRD